GPLPGPLPSPPLAIVQSPLCLTGVPYTAIGIWAIATGTKETTLRPHPTPCPFPSPARLRRRAETLTPPPTPPLFRKRARGGETASTFSPASGERG
ncbi:MAG: hypothetical protein RMK65_09190, partial [Anaerolineae bacterium]|nr:hypothetical protein [Anaerolineae bacterium]